MPAKSRSGSDIPPAQHAAKTAPDLIRGESDENSLRTAIRGRGEPAGVPREPAASNVKPGHRARHPIARSAVEVALRRMQMLTTNEAREALKILSRDKRMGVLIAEAAQNVDCDDVDAPQMDSLLRATGGVLSTAEVTKLLGVTRQSVNDQVSRRKLLGLRFGSRWKFPKIQFRNREPLPGLGAVLGAIGPLDPWDALTILLAPELTTHERPIFLLRAGNKVGAMVAAIKISANLRRPDFEPKLHMALDADLEADLNSQ